MEITEFQESKNIHLLPEHLIDQIKAGEVIERPSSLIKELVENCIDAKSTKIDIHLIENGMELISIIDNGNGMEVTDLPYAFCRHATSKISRFDDLYRLKSYGFRGEALASIAAVSKITCTTSTNSEVGGKIIIHGGEQKSLSTNVSHNKGTSFFIKDLFYNTPARLKFIKSKASEKNALKRIINSFLLSNPEVSFSVKWDDKEKKIYKSTSIQERIKTVFFPKAKGDESLVHFEAEYEGHIINGFATKHCSKGNIGKHHYLFANGRLFTDRQIHQTVLRNLEKLWSFGETGHYCLNITTPPSAIDVNVHPNKTLIKFFKLPMLLSLLSTELKKIVTINKSESTQLPNNTQSSFISEGSSFDLVENVNQANSQYQESNSSFEFIDNKLISLTKKYSIYKVAESLNQYLLDNEKLVSFYYSTNLEENRQIADHMVTPLLISEPFTVTDKRLDRYFGELKEIGFEVDRLDHETIALRSIPKYLDYFSGTGLFNFIIEVLVRPSSTIDKLSEVIKAKYKEKTPLTEKQIHFLLNNFSLAQLIDNSIAKELNDEVILKLWN